MSYHHHHQPPRQGMRALHEDPGHYQHPQPPGVPQSYPDQLDVGAVNRCIGSLVQDQFSQRGRGPSGSKRAAADELKQISDDFRFRRPLAMMTGVIEGLAAAILEVNQSAESEQVGQYCLATLQNLTLEDPYLDVYIANEESILPSLVHVMRQPHEMLHEQAALLLDYLSISKENQTLICTAENVLPAIVATLRDSVVLNTRDHLLQSLVYLSSHATNIFMMAREPGMLDVLQDCMDPINQATIRSKAFKVFANLARLRENIADIAAHAGIRGRMRTFVDTAHEDPDTLGQVALVMQLIEDYENGL